MNSSSKPSSAPELSPKKTYRLMAGMAVAAMLLIGLAIYSLSQINSLAPASSLANLDLNPTLRQDLPQFEYPDQGKVLNAQSFAGHWTLLTFWAHWCQPCLAEMPALSALGQQSQGQSFQILTVNVDDPESDDFEAAHTFLSEQNIELATLYDRTGVLKKAFAVEDLPRHFLIGPDMKIRWQARGAFKWNDPSAKDQLTKIIANEVGLTDSGEDESADGGTTTEKLQGAESPPESAK